MDHPQEYILKQLTSIKEEKTADPAWAYSSMELTELIYNRLLSKKFRKYSTPPDYKVHIRSAIALNIAKSEPIKLALAFGGYKLWRLPEAPEVDWAELFFLIYLAHWLQPICGIYGPGVWFDFSSSDIIVPQLNNIPKSDINAYVESFLRLIQFLQAFLPGNMNISLTRVSSRYTKEEFGQELAEKMEGILQKNNNRLPDVNEKQKHRIELNVKPTEDQKSDPMWQRKNFLLYEAYLTLDKVLPYYRTPDKIVVSSSSRNGSLAIGTTKTSIVKPWVGVGVLKETVGNDFVESIIPPSKVAAIEGRWVDMSITGLTGKNFKKIRVLK